MTRVQCLPKSALELDYMYDKRAVSLPKSREQRYIKAINNIPSSSRSLYHVLSDAPWWGTRGVEVTAPFAENPGLSVVLLLLVSPEWRLLSCFLCFHLLP